MDLGMYVLTTQRIALMRNLDVVANNIANANTDGFRANLLTQQTFTTGRSTGGQTPLSFPADNRTYLDRRNGAARATGRPLDAAIVGEGFFTVQTPNGVRYTRHGSFTLDENRQLVTSEGYPVLGEGGGPILFGEEDTQIRFREDGGIGGGTDGEQDIGRLEIVQFDNEQLLERLPNGLYASNTAPRAAEGFRLANAMLEGSNVEPVRETTRMIEVQRGIVNADKQVKRMDELQRRAVNLLSGQNG